MGGTDSPASVVRAVLLYLIGWALITWAVPLLFQLSGPPVLGIIAVVVLTLVGLYPTLASLAVGWAVGRWWALILALIPALLTAPGLTPGCWGPFSRDPGGFCSEAPGWDLLALLGPFALPPVLICLAIGVWLSRRLVWVGRDAASPKA